MKPLSLDQLKIARQKALTNARELVEEAKLLFEKEHWARALFLSQIAGEEIGKYILLSSTAVNLIAGDEIQWSKFWKRLTSHREKQTMITYIEDILLDQPFSDDLSHYFKELEKQVNDMEVFKQKSLYCDFTLDFPHSPSDVVTKEIAENALKWSNGRLELFSGIEEKLKSDNAFEKISGDFIQKFRERYGIIEFFKKKKA